MNVLSPTDDRREQVRAERRLGRVVGPLTLAGLGLTLAAVLVSAAAARNAGDADTLRQFAANRDDQLVAASLRVGGLLLTLPLILFLQRVLAARDPDVPRALAIIGLSASLLIAISTMLGWFALRDAADALVAGEYRTEREALDSSGLLTAVRWIDILSRLLFASWLAYASLRASRVGLITSFLGLWGLIAAFSGTFLPLGDALYVGWAASIALLALGYWPGGRPPSWTSGRAEPWTVPADRGDPHRTTHDASDR